jgi:Zn-dependent metalloprotease
MSEKENEIVLGNVKAKGRNPNKYDIPKQIYDIETEPTSEDPRVIAESFLKSSSDFLKIDPSLENLKFDKVNKSILGSHALFQQYVNDKPISGAWIKIDMDKEGSIYNVNNDLIPEEILKMKKIESTLKAKQESKIISLGDAISHACSDLRIKETDAEILENELVYFSCDDALKQSWKLVIRVKNPIAEWKIYVDSITGTILSKINQIKEINAAGRVFDPNPVITLNNIHLSDGEHIPDSAYVEVTLNDLESNGMLDGPFVSTDITNNRIKVANMQFLFKREDKAFKEVMVYYHIDRVQRYIQGLGFDNVLNRPISVSIDGTMEDNSFYSPSAKSLTFGTGGVDDAEDAEIILHEYGHAIQDNILPGFGPRGEARAMGEGFGDYLAASFFEKAKPNLLKPTIGNWDAVAYSGANPPCLRRLDSNKKYPKDVTGEEHDDGEIWSSCLWQLRNGIGQDKCDKLIIAHHFLLARTSSFEDAANALIITDRQLNQGQNEEAIRDVFTECGIFPNPRNNKRSGEKYENLC